VATHLVSSPEFAEGARLGQSSRNGPEVDIRSSHGGDVHNREAPGSCGPKIMVGRNEAGSVISFDLAAGKGAATDKHDPTMDEKNQ